MEHSYAAKGGIPGVRDVAALIADNAKWSQPMPLHDDAVRKGCAALLLYRMDSANQGLASVRAACTA